MVEKLSDFPIFVDNSLKIPPFYSVRVKKHYKQDGLWRIRISNNRHMI
jgi:hypothetical protein